MKNLIISLSIIVSSQCIFAQLPAIDALSNAASVALTAEYALLSREEDNIKREMEEFKDSYSTRAIPKFDIRYFAPGDSYVQHVKNKLIDARARRLILETNNNALTVFSYSRKKQNSKDLYIVEASLNNITQKFEKKLKHYGVYGEKMNMYQNFMRSLDKINRLMDQIDSKIDEGKLLNKLVN
ncbi:hypothetical protein [Aquimarina sp. 2201CG14-23]|uniref:hypothetical protein n=1 Tax=Aquimarina mycalae TaxID=3040073 RepID=UPI002477D76A|nr:hypothetical protein [Aquimarina sp. 2201CG14-23]MDH7445847.1 hypothetical protein [Aquimarina sp. 2201CG14-23]